MKYLKKFNEAIIDWKSDNLENFIKEGKDFFKDSKKIPIDKLKEIGDKHDVEVVPYSTFYEELPTDKMRKDAPPSYGSMGIFGLVNPVTNKMRVVLFDVIKELDESSFMFIIHMLKHENIHIKQRNKKSDNISAEYLGNIRDKSAYFSNKDEIMAFSQSLADLAVNNGDAKDIKDGFNIIQYHDLWKAISQSVNDKVLKKYKKYIYLYLEKELKEN